MATRRKHARDILGWREWADMPDLGIRVRAKVDTGAQSSALHAIDLDPFERAGDSFVRFRVYRDDSPNSRPVVAEAKLIGTRRVRSSSGAAEVRALITTTLRIAGKEWPIDVTLTRRELMGFRMLLGREAIRRRFLVDPARSYVAGRHPGEEESE